MSNNINVIQTTLLNPSSQLTLDEAILSTQEWLRKIETNNDLFSIANVAFGDNFDTDKLELLRKQWKQQEFSDFPRIEIRSSADINGANGAFSKDLNTIYLATEYLRENVSNPDAIADVVLEEIGHFIDSQINESDPPFLTN